MVMWPSSSFFFFFNLEEYYKIDPGSMVVHRARRWCLELQAVMYDAVQRARKYEAVRGLKTQASSSDSPTL